MLNNGLEQFDHINLNKPVKCEKCDCENIKYNGIGEYECEECKFVMYDDYGKVRNYIEEHPGATATDVSLAVGVSKEKIRRLLREDKIQIAPGSATFLYCEKCGAGIRSGRFCFKCLEEETRANKTVSNHRSSNIAGGFGKSVSGQSGAMRYDKK